MGITQHADAASCQASSSRTLLKGLGRPDQAHGTDSIRLDLHLLDGLLAALVLRLAVRLHHAARYA
ncbi:hypothetical protein ACS0Y3_33525, partial [Burkholderia gladioli]|uniref:hypothetical protein n=1 Tax=Burkholderia gladioli TaxID=28095 RepID=UPI003F7A8E7B